MNCKTAQKQMALAVGEDLDAGAAVALQNHLADCVPCTQQWEQNQRGFEALQQLQAAVEDTRCGSVWPVVSQRIRERQSRPRRRESQGLVAGLAAVAACVLITVFALDGLTPGFGLRDRVSIFGGEMPRQPNIDLYDPSWEPVAHFAPVPNQLQDVRQFHTGASRAIQDN